MTTIHHLRNIDNVYAFSKFRIGDWMISADNGNENTLMFKIDDGLALIFSQTLENGGAHCFTSEIPDNYMAYSIYTHIHMNKEDIKHTTFEKLKIGDFFVVNSIDDKVHYIKTDLQEAVRIDDETRNDYTHKMEHVIVSMEQEVLNFNETNIHWHICDADPLEIWMNVNN